MSLKLVPQEISMVVGSNPSLGAQNLSTAPNSFDAFRVQLDEPIHVPPDAQNVTLRVEGTNIWNNEPNIITGVNDALRVTAPNTSDVSTIFDITIPQGSYSVSELNQRIQVELANAGAKTSPDPVISITPDEATQKIELRLNYLGVVVDFTVANSCWEILGFTPASVIGPPTIAGESFLAPNEAKFNVINYYLISSNLVSRGIRTNNTYRNIINQTNINVRPNSLITSEPFNPSVIQCDELKGAVRSTFEVRLLKDDFTPANTRGEYFSVRMSIRYLMPMMF
jgi:hypothetical protein